MGKYSCLNAYKSNPLKAHKIPQLLKKYWQKKCSHVQILIGISYHQITPLDTYLHECYSSNQKLFANHPFSVGYNLLFLGKAKKKMFMPKNIHGSCKMYNTMPAKAKNRVFVYYGLLYNHFYEKRTWLRGNLRLFKKYEKLQT